jgi:hypothetical protein
VQCTGRRRIFFPSYDKKNTALVHHIVTARLVQASGSPTGCDADKIRCRRPASPDPRLSACRALRRSPCCAGTSLHTCAQEHGGATSVTFSVLCVYSVLAWKQNTSRRAWRRDDWLVADGGGGHRNVCLARSQAQTAGKPGLGGSATQRHASHPSCAAESATACGPQRARPTEARGRKERGGGGDKLCCFVQRADQKQKKTGSPCRIPVSVPRSLTLLLFQQQH